VYSGGSFRNPTRRPSHGDIPWRDTHIQIEGPVVAQFQKLFIETWNKQDGPPLTDPAYFPQLKNNGAMIVRPIATSPELHGSVLYGTLLSAIAHAQRSIHLTNAYFVPDPALVSALKDAARRGVEVRLVLPAHSDLWAPLYAGRSHYSELLDAGVEIYERRAVLLHAKTGVIDGVWSTVGSSNLDWRSFLHNDELDAVVLGPEFGEQMEAAFDKDLAASQRITRESWANRPFDSRFREWAARLWERWL
jgi:cardiolipin synthase